MRSPRSRDKAVLERGAHGLARTLSKLGLCSRTRAAELVRQGRVTVDGRTVRDPEERAPRDIARIALDGRPLATSEKTYVMLHKPRGLVTSARDERGRDTVYRCFADAGLPWLAPVGRLDKASEGLLLFTNDTAWAAGVLDPLRGPDKRYHVEIDRRLEEERLAVLVRGVESGGEHLAAKRVSILRVGTPGMWLEVVLGEGRNRQIRRMFAALGSEVLRLVRVAIGPLELGDLPPGAWRHLTPSEIAKLAVTTPRRSLRAVSRPATRKV